MNGSELISRYISTLGWSGAVPVYLTPFSSSSLGRPTSFATGMVVKESLFLNLPVILSGAICTSETVPSTILLRKSE